MREMDNADRLEAKGLARAKIRAKRRRVQAIRRRTLRGSLALFAAVWAVVFAQLVSGNDPALSNIPHPSHRPVASTGSEPAREPEPEEEAELEEEAEPALEAEPLPEEEFAPEAEPEVVPEEEFAPEPEVEVEPAPEPEPIVTASS
jgi:outer membrane biosynthesis protein TonB